MRRPGEDAHTGNDPVLALYRNYFAAARRLQEEVATARERAELSLGEDRDNTLTRLEVFLPLWLSALFTTCEGFRKIGSRDARVDALIRENMASLRRVWQHTINYHDDPTQKKARAGFYGVQSNNLNKAEELHRALEQYFRNHVIALSEQSPR